MYVKELLNSKNIEMKISSDSFKPIKVYKYYKDKEFKVYYHFLTDLYNQLHTRKVIHMHQNTKLKTIQFNFDESKLEVCPENKLKVSIELCI